MTYTVSRYLKSTFILSPVHTGDEMALSSDLVAHVIRGMTWRDRMVELKCSDCDRCLWRDFCRESSTGKGEIVEPKLHPRISFLNT
jgi:hypothetical protein